MFKILLLLALTLTANAGFLQNIQEDVDFPVLYQNLKNANLTDFFLAFDGFSSTVGIYSEMPAFEACKVDDAGVVEASVDLIQDLVNGQTGTLIDDIKTLVDHIYDVHKKCDFAGFKTQFLQGLSDVKSNFTQPDYLKKLLAGLQSNIFQLMADLKTIIDAVNAQNYEDFGKRLGSLIRLVLVVPQASTQ